MKIEPDESYEENVKRTTYPDPVHTMCTEMCAEPSTLNHEHLSLGFQFFADMISRLFFIIVILLELGAFLGTFNPTRLSIM